MQEQIAQHTKKGRKFLSEFKDFAIRGNVIDMAIGVVIGTAFSGIIKALVDNILMPLIGLITAGNDFENLKFVFGDGSSIKYGLFIQAIVNFIIITFCIFIVIKVLNKIWPKKSNEGEKASVTEVQLLTEIRDSLLKIEQSRDS
jgi:large conductance mechanosensitive channel